MGFMNKKERKYIYISNLNYSGSVYQTQVLDWLSLYKTHNLEFDLIQAFHVKDLKRPGYIKKQIKGIRNSTSYFVGSLYLLPSKSILYVINAFLIFCKIFKYIIRYKEVLIFSRAIIGKEILVLRHFSPARIIFYFDARAAAAEENKYVAALRNDYSLRSYNIIANTYYLVHQTLCAADKIFTVSNVLKEYFIDTYHLHDKKFVSYPCLSDSSKFYYDTNIRNELRAAMGITEGTKVFIYSGGINEWHVAEKMFNFIHHLFKHEKGAMLIFLTKSQVDFEKMLNNFGELKAYSLSFSVPNNEVYKYLNAADFGFLFRENTIMNNVASPTKFAEYTLCGLPVLISEGVGDYSDYAVKHNLGVLVKESELNDPEKFDFDNFLRMKFDRIRISDIGIKNFSKDSIINNLISEFKS
jgi:hypothetical protein